MLSLVKISNTKDMPATEASGLIQYSIIKSIKMECSKAVINLKEGTKSA